VFQYQYDLSVAEASKGIDAFQSFVQTNIPQEFGAEINLGKGSAAGRVSFTIVGGWYAPPSKLNATIAPLLAQLPNNPKVTLDVGTYINSVQVLAGSQSLNTTTAPDVHDTFYAKSLMTPASSPMSTAAITAFMNYLANEGFASTTVCIIIFACERHLIVIYYLAMVLSGGTVWRHEFRHHGCSDRRHRLCAQKLHLYYPVLCLVSKLPATLPRLWAHVPRW
jgi:hypothetical protein